MIKVYSIGSCRPCKELKDWLKENDIEYTVISYSQEVYRKAGVKHLPTIDIDGVLYDGWTNGEIRKAVKKSKYYSN